MDWDHDTWMFGSGMGILAGYVASFWVALCLLSGNPIAVESKADAWHPGHLRGWHWAAAGLLAILPGVIAGLIGLLLVYAGLTLYMYATGAALLAAGFLLTWFGLSAAGVWVMAEMISSRRFVQMALLGVGVLVGARVCGAMAAKDQSRELAFNSIVALLFGVAMVCSGIALRLVA